MAERNLLGRASQWRWHMTVAAGACAEHPSAWQVCWVGGAERALETM